MLITYGEGAFVLAKADVSRIIEPKYILNDHIYTPRKKAVAPALWQAGTAINTRNIWCIILKWDSFIIKQHIVSKLLRLVSAVISLSKQHNTPLVSPHLEVGVIVFLPCVCSWLIG